MSPFPFVLSLSLALLAGASNVHRSNQAVAHRSHANRTTHEKRDDGGGYSGHATYFADGLGACGGWNGPNDYIVALNTPQYGGGGDCGKQIQIQGLGKSAVATIVDECPGCPYGCLDFSQGLFLHFADLGVGEFPISWNWLGADDTPPPTKKPAPPPPTTTHHSTTTTHSTTSTTPTTTAASATGAAPSSSNTASASGDGGGSGGQQGTGGGNIANQQRLVYIYGNIATFGKSVTVSS